MNWGGFRRGARSSIECDGSCHGAEFALCERSGFRVHGPGRVGCSDWIFQGSRVTGAGPGLLLEELKDATGAGLASDRVEPVQQRLAIDYARGCGTKGWISRRNHHTLAGSPRPPADYARSVIADVFDPGAFRIMWFFVNLKLPQSTDQSPSFDASASHRFSNLLLSLITAKFFAWRRRVRSCVESA